MSLTKTWRLPTLSGMPDWPLRRQILALRRAVAGDPSLLDQIPAQAEVGETTEPAEYVGLFRRQADELEEAGKPVEAIKLRLQKGIR